MFSNKLLIHLLLMFLIVLNDKLWLESYKLLKSLLIIIMMSIISIKKIVFLIRIKTTIFCYPKLNPMRVLLYSLTVMKKYAESRRVVNYIM